MGNTQAAVNIIGRGAAPSDGRKPSVSVVPEAEKPGEAGASPKQEAPKADYCDLYAAPVHRLPTLLGYLFMAAVMYAGWLLRNEEYLTAESGPGYALGIIGGTMMLMLLLYPLRKQMRFMRKWGAIKYWFKGHMLFGIVGPVLILFHAGFRPGSLNSTVALVSMLLVAGSGLVGRYIYAKIHYGLYGRQMNLKDLQGDIEEKKNILKHVLTYAPALQKRILAFDEAALMPRYSFLGSTVRFVVLSLRAPWNRLVLRLGLRRALKVAALRQKWSERERRQRSRAARLHISIHIAAALRVSRFRIFERFFALWSLLHLPLFFILVLVAVAHVVAVHMF